MVPGMCGAEVNQDGRRESAAIKRPNCETAEDSVRSQYAGFTRHCRNVGGSDAKMGGVQTLDRQRRCLLLGGIKGQKKAVHTSGDEPSEQ